MSFDKNEIQNGRRYYWLKLKDNFFGELTTIAMRKQKGGDAVVIAYLKLMLSGLKSGGEIRYEGILETLEDELALVFGESRETMEKCIESMVRFKLAERTENGLKLTALEELVGSESYSARRMRERRASTDQPEEFEETELPAEFDESNEVNNVQLTETFEPSDQPTSEIIDLPEAEMFSNYEPIEASQEVHNVQTLCESVQNCAEMCALEKRKKKKEKRSKKVERESGLPPADVARPTLAQVSEYCAERGDRVNPARWYDYYTANGFMVGKSKMCDWKACVRSWENNGVEKSAAVPLLNTLNLPESYQNSAW